MALCIEADNLKQVVQAARRFAVLDDTSKRFSISFSMQVALVEFCIEADDLKQAVQAARRFVLLDDAFPGLERAYKSRTIGKLAVKRQWAVAAAVAGDDPQLQVGRQFKCMTAVQMLQHKDIICTNGGGRLPQ